MILYVCLISVFARNEPVPRLLDLVEYLTFAHILCYPTINGTPNGRLVKYGK